MNAIRLHKVLEHDGELVLTGLPYRKGQKIELIVLSEILDQAQPPLLTADKLLHSEIVGLWKERKDIVDSSAYARQLREQAQRRTG